MAQERDEFISFLGLSTSTCQQRKSNSCSHHFHAIKIFAKKKIMLNITNFLDENSFRITQGTPQYHPSLPFPISDG